MPLYGTVTDEDEDGSTHRARSRLRHLENEDEAPRIQQQSVVAGQPFRPSGIRGRMYDIALYEHQQQQAALAGLEAQRQEEETGLLQQTSDVQQALQQDAAGRGVARSGFAGEAMTDLSSREGGALAAIQSGHKRRVQDYYSQMAAMARERKQKRRARKNRWIGSALGAGAMIATGGAAAPLVAGYMSSQGQSF